MAGGADKNRLPRFAPNALLVWKGRDWNKVADMLERWRTLPGRNTEGQVTHAGTLIHAQATGEAAAENTCAFGSIYRDGSQWKLRGGPLIAGPDSYTIADENFSVALDFDKVYWIEVDFEANADTVADRLFPGIASSSTPTWEHGAAYADQVIPSGTDPTGKAVIPVGRLVIVDDVPTFTDAGQCGTITVSHCPGSVSH